jgi:leucine-zipper-like transcriptional regulator 1
MQRTVFAVVTVLLSTTFAQMTGTCATDSAPWAPRTDHASVVFDGKMWVLGGALVSGPPEVFANDVWRSTNGADWTRVKDSAPWSPRCPEAVVFDNKIWVIGGWRNSTGGGLNDLWYSTDGDSWVCATASAGWTTRGGHGVTVFNGKMWVVGGYSNGGRRDVWYSTDGANWTCAIDTAPWLGRYYPAVVEFDSMLWVIGGIQSRCFNDVWYSTDGTNWTQATGSAGWSKRAGQGAVVLDGKMWVLGGMPDPPWKLRVNDVWYSTDCARWTCADSSAEWLPRGWHRPSVYGNKIWVIGGDSTENSPRSAMSGTRPDWG